MNLKKQTLEQGVPFAPVRPKMHFLLLLFALLCILTGVNQAHAAPTFQAVGTAVNGTGDVSPAWPAHLTNDIALLFVETSGPQIATVNPATGFVPIASSPQLSGNDANHTQLTVFWARATSNAMPSITILDTGDHTYAQIITYRGVATTGNPWDVTSGGAKSTASGTVSVTGVTTSEADTLIVQAASRQLDSGAATFSAQTNATLSGIVERFDDGTTSGNGGGFAVWDGVKATAGATGNTTANVTSSVNAFITIALKSQFPIVSSLDRASANPTTPATSVSWTVVFNKSVTGVNAADFSLVQTGAVAGATITGVSGSGTTWTVTANTGSGDGTLGLNLVDNDSIIDASGQSLGGAGAANGNFTGQVYSIPAPTVVSINRASTNPTAGATSVTWTVTFDKSVTGADVADFVLVQGGGVSGASITSVTGSGATRTVTASTGSGTGTLGLNLVDDDTIIDGASLKLGGTGAGNGNFTGQVYTITAPFCSPPSNIPGDVSVTCVCDTFGRANLDPSTIYGGSWITSVSDTTGILPRIVNPGYLRLTESTANNAKAATVPAAFPAAGNYISVEFQQYAYSGTGADGIAVTLSDYSTPAVPGAFGGSLGYAQKTGTACIAGDATAQCPGFAGGWVGIALDEWGNFQSPTEGRIGGPGQIAQSVGIRGSGSGVTGYNWLAGTGGGQQIDNAGSATPSRGYYYQVVVDARVPANTSVAVNRDTGTGYASMINLPNIFTTAAAQGVTQDPVPSNWQISFTGSTGGARNIHEISGLRICAQSVVPPTGGVANGANAIDEAYGTPPLASAVNYLTGHIYTKLVGTPFKLNVAMLNNSQIQKNYVVSGSKDVALKLVDNSDGVCVLDSSQVNYCSVACRGKTAVTGGSQTLTFVNGDQGQKQSANFTLNTAYSNLVAIISEGTTNACSTDAFSVRPTSVATVVSTNATNAGTTGAPVFRAGSGNFNLTATVAGVAANPNGYTGNLRINNAVLQVSGLGTAATNSGMINPAIFPGAASGAQTAIATSPSFTYSEVGTFLLPGYTVASNSVSPRGVYDGVTTATDCTVPGLTAVQCDALRAATWTGIDSITAKGDCVLDSYSNTLIGGKYGCNFGNVANTAIIGRFIPDHFSISNVSFFNRDGQTCVPASSFTYMDEPMRAVFTLRAENAGGNTTINYKGNLERMNLGIPANFGLGALDSYSTSTARSITQITNASPGVVTTSANHGYMSGDTVYINAVNGMVELNNSFVTVMTVITPTSFSIGNNTSGYAAYISGGTALQKASIGIDRTSRVFHISSSGTWVDGVAQDIPFVFSFNRALDGPFWMEFGIAPQDLDLVGLIPQNMDVSTPDGDDHTSFALTYIRNGRIRLSNAYGSELLQLAMPLKTEYFLTGTGWVSNSDDSCTSLAVPTSGNFGLVFDPQTARNQLAPGEVIGRWRNLTDTLDMTPNGTVNNGNGNLRLTGPSGVTVGPGATNFGYVVVTFDLSAQPWLRFNWNGTGPIDDPRARATFGTYKSPVIYIRETY